jgi:hypothetical protein
MPPKRAPDSVKQARVNEAADVLYAATGEFPVLEDVAHQAKMSSRDIGAFFREWKANQMVAASTFRLSQNALEGLDKLKAEAEKILKTEVAWLTKDHEAALNTLREWYTAELQKEIDVFTDKNAELETKIEYLQAQLQEHKAENAKLITELTGAQALNISKSYIQESLQQVVQNLMRHQAQSDVASGEETVNAAA